MIDRDALEARVRRIADKLGPRVHDFLVRESGRHGVSINPPNAMATIAYMIAVTNILGDELGSMSTCLGPRGGDVVRLTFLDAFERGAREMEADHNRAEARLN